MAVTPKYNSSINVMGSIPDFASMIDYITVKLGRASQEGSFRFRTDKSLIRFDKAIDDSILRFVSDKHMQLFTDAICSKDIDMQSKLLMLFWQIVCSNTLFKKITEDVFMKAVYSGRASIMADEVFAYLKYLKELEPTEFNWSEATIKITASKYLTLMKKLGLASGAIRKEILHPSISSELFVYFIRLSLTVYPEEKTLKNELLPFGFFDVPTIINRLKRIEYIDYWTITQIGSDITIELK